MVPYRDYVPLVNLIGIYFQIRDDYMNLQSDQVSFILLLASYLSHRRYRNPVHGE